MSLRFENEIQFKEFLDSEKLDNIDNKLTFDGFMKCYTTKSQVIYDLNKFGVGGILGLLDLSINYSISSFSTLNTCIENNVLQSGAVRDRNLKFISFILSLLDVLFINILE